MSNVDDGGPAFPHTVTTGADGGQHFPLDYALGGMSLRDYFAAFALIGWRETAESLRTDAENAYKMADAMLEARQR